MSHMNGDRTKQTEGKTRLQK